MKIKGHIDRADNDGFGGWILDQDNPALRLEISVSLGHTIIGTCIADRFRKDLHDGGLHDGRFGFRYDLPNSLSAEEKSSLTIGVIGTDYRFKYRAGPPVSGMAADECYNQAAAVLRRDQRLPRRFKTCILHIGTEKTGTTSLQNALGLNRGMLETKGYFVPKSLVSIREGDTLNHTHLTMLSMGDDRFDDELRRQHAVYNKDDLNQARRDLFIRLSEEISHAGSECHTMILSNEHCHSRLTNVGEIFNLKDLLDRFCESYRVVVYLRPQHELAISQHGMFVANGAYDIDICPPLPAPPDYKKNSYSNRAYFDYAALLNRWAHVFGINSLWPRIYAADALRGGNVVSDFLSEVLLIEADVTLPPRLNSNINQQGLAFLEAFYRHFGNQDRPGSAMLRERVRNAVKICYPGAGAIPSRAQVEAFLGQFEVGNEEVRARWFPNRAKLFSPDLARFPEVAPEPNLTTGQIISTFVDVLLRDQMLHFSRVVDGNSSLI